MTTYIGQIEGGDVTMVAVRANNLADAVRRIGYVLQDMGQVGVVVVAVLCRGRRVR